MIIEWIWQAVCSVVGVVGGLIPDMLTPDGLVEDITIKYTEGLDWLASAIEPVDNWVDVGLLFSGMALLAAYRAVVWSWSHIRDLWGMVRG